MKPFERKRPDLGQVRQIKQWVRARLGLLDDVHVVVTELACSEPGCPPIETAVTLVLAEGAEGTKTRKIHRPISEIAKADIDRLWAESDTKGGFDAHDKH